MEAHVNSVIDIPLTLPGISTIRRELTLNVWDYVNEENNITEAFIEYEEYLGVPRQQGLHYAQKYQLDLVWETSSGLPCYQDNKPIDLWEYQKPWVEDIVRRFQNGAMDISAMAHTGAGKTIMSLEIIRRIGRAAIVFVDQEFLKNQWVDNAKKFLKLEDTDIGFIQGKVCDYEGKSLVIAMVQTLYNREYAQEVYEYFGTVVFDECFHPSHEVLTARGWVSITKVTYKDLVAQVNPTTQEITFVAPVKLIKKRFRGNLINLHNVRCDLLATPNHEHLVFWKGGDDSTKVPYGELSVTNRWYQLYGGTVAGNDNIGWIHRFRVAYQADGTYLRYKQSSSEHHIRFSFRKERKIIRICEILDNICCKYNVKVNSRGDTNIQVWVKDRPDKTLQWITLNRSSSYYEQLLEEFVVWDGTIAGNTSIYYSSIEDNVDKVQCVAILAGFVATKKVRLSDRIKHGNSYRVSWISGRKRPTKSLDKSKVYYNGLVYCVRMPEGTVVTRRNGKVTVTGNCHTLGAAQFSQVLMQFPADNRLGISATPDRKDGLQKILDYNLGPVKVELNAKHDKSTVRYVQYDGVVSWYANSSKKSGRYINELASDNRRNLLLSRIIKYLRKDDGQVLVVSDRIEHLEYLMALCYYLGVPDGDMGLVTGTRNIWKYAKDPTPLRKPEWLEKNTEYTPVKLQQVKKRLTKAELDNTKNTAPIIFATYGMFSKGVDVPRLCSGIDCTPRAKAEQLHGRILRKQEGKRESMWVTIRDIMSYKAEYQFARRLSDYNKSNAEIYRWSLEKGTKTVEVRGVIRAANRRVEKLKRAQIVTNVDGNYTIVM